MIFCFSGNGNSRLVARGLAHKLGDEIVDITSGSEWIYPLGPHHRHIIWVFPVHSWGLPKFLKQFIAEVRMPNAQRLPHHMVATCGDDAGLTHRMWQKAIRKRDWSPSCTFTVQMPNTYVLLPGFDVDQPATVQTKLKAMPSRIDEIAQAIASGKHVNDVVTGSMAWLKTRIIYPVFMRFLTSPKPFHHTDRCIHCGKCSQACPMGNITMLQGYQPHWGSRCTLCLGCYNICPRHAVAYGRATASKGQYYCTD